MKVVLIGGEPASGKTAIIHRIIKDKKIKIFKKDYIDGLYFENTIIIGKYNYDQFDGTDKMAMDIQPKFIKFLSKMRLMNINVILEGDRLVNSKTIDYLIENKIKHKVVLITCDDIEFKKRRYQRQQDKMFVKSKKTKYQNLADKYNYKFEKNNSISQSNKIIKIIYDFIY